MQLDDTGLRIPSGGSRWRITVFADDFDGASITMEVQDEQENWIAIPDAESDSNDAYELSLRNGDLVRYQVAGGSPTGLFVAAKAIVQE